MRFPSRAFFASVDVHITFFFKIMVGYPNRKELATIMGRTTRQEQPQINRIMDKDTVRKWIDFARQVVLAEHVQDYIVRIILATQPTSEFATLTPA